MKKNSPAIDWNEIRGRLAGAEAALEQGISLSREKTKSVLQERAQALSREPVESRNAEDQIEVLEFLLAYERYAVEASYVREVYPLKDLTPLPGTPPFVLGIINMRGRILSVVDLKKLMDLPEKGLTDLHKVIVISDGDMEFGLLADAVQEVGRIPKAEIQPALPTLIGLKSEYLKGVTGQRVVVLEVGQILADPQLKVCQNWDT
jgi:purine-binding chemotaxis protein CheW